jgi:Uma2 family endonuclease
MSVLTAFVPPHRVKVKRFPQPKLLTFKDYERLTPPDNGNYELHNGKIVFMASPLEQHQTVAFKLTLKIGNYIMAHKLGKLLFAPMDTILTPNDTVQPDLLFITNERLHIIDRQVKGAPDLIIEILSDSNSPKEMSYKKYIYETTGVREYWIVNIEKQLVTQYENIEEEFIIRKIARMNDSLTSFVIEGFQIDVNDILP